MTNVAPDVTPPTLWNYAVCGQYPGVVGSGATVTLKCACGLAAYRYVIVHFPIVNNGANFCELEVYISRKYLYGHSVITCDESIATQFIQRSTDDNADECI